MNRFSAACLLTAAVLCLALAGCSADGSSAAQLPAPDIASQASSAVSDGVSSSLPASSGVASSEASSAYAPSASSSSQEEWILQYVSLPLDGDTGDTRLLVLETPSDWTFDTYSTFTGADGHKTAEVLGLYTVEGDMAFPTQVSDQYADDGGMYPEGYGLQRSDNVRVHSRQILTYYYKAWPDDADQPWYPRYCFVNLGGYVVQINFFTFDENNDDTVFDRVIASMELHSSGETNSGASS